MKSPSRYIILMIMLLFAGAGKLRGQSGFFVPEGGSIFFSGDSSSIYSDVFNNGKFGVGRNAYVNFIGKEWINDPQSLITDESNSGQGSTGNGGVVRFLATDSFPQLLQGGYNAATRTGPTFSRLHVQSNGGVVLNQGNVKVRNELKLLDGLVYVKDNILVVGHNNPGLINGYDSTRYIVTDIRGNEGFLLREHISRQNGTIVFPVGSKAHSYTPVGIYNRAEQFDHFYVNVLDGVRGQIGRPGFLEEGVNSTWHIGKQLRPGRDDVTVTLEHLTGNEGSFFAANRDKSYVSQYTGFFWEEGYPQKTPAPGTLTTGDTLFGSGDNSRVFSGTISASSHFTKFTGKGDSSRVGLWFNGYRIDTNFVRVYWRTNPEINNRLFIVQRRLSNETVFTSVDTVMTKAPNGVSFSYLNYETIDLNPYRGVSFYRLQMVDKFEDTTYSQVVAVAGLPGKHRLFIWPNPTPDRFFVDLNGEVDVKTIVVWDVLGQKLHQEDVNGRQIIEMGGFIPGTYLIGFISTKGNIIETKKLLVVGR